MGKSINDTVIDCVKFREVVNMMTSDQLFFERFWFLE